MAFGRCGTALSISSQSSALPAVSRVWHKSARLLAPTLRAGHQSGDDPVSDVTLAPWNSDLRLWPKPSLGDGGFDSPVNPWYWRPENRFARLAFCPALGNYSGFIAAPWQRAGKYPENIGAELALTKWRPGARGDRAPRVVVWEGT